MSADRERETRETRLEADLAAWLYDHPSNYDRVSLCDQAADMIAGPLAPALRAVREHDALRRDLAALHRPDEAEVPFCTECGHCWPCHTARLLDGGEGGR